MPSLARQIRLARDVGLKVVPALHRARRRYGASWPFLLGRMRTLLRRRFKPGYAFTLGMLDPSYTEERLRESLSKRELVDLQDRLNPGPWTPLTLDKSLFYRYCALLGLPIPELHAIWFRANAGWSPAGSLRTIADWEDLFLRRVPGEFIVKPSEGLYGYGFRLFRREGDRFTDHHGVAMGVREILDRFREDPRFRSYVVQSRLTGHPELRRLSGTDALQCLRLVTLIGPDGAARVIHAHMKIIVGANTLDNIEAGKTGNIHGVVDLASGTFIGGNIMSLDGSGNSACTHHPGTGVLMAGVPVPCWREACELTCRAAPAFSPLRTIGWDVAITPEGPYLLEANNWYDPPPMRQGVSMRELVARLTEALPPPGPNAPAGTR